MRSAAAVLALLQVPGLWACRAKVTIELKVKKLRAGGATLVGTRPYVALLLDEETE